MANFILREPPDQGGIFEIELCSGEIVEDETQLLWELRKALCSVRSSEDREQELIALKEIAHRGLIDPNHSAKTWLAKLNAIIRQRSWPNDYLWYDGKYWSAAYVQGSTDEFPRLIYYINEGKPPREYYDFLNRWEEVRYGLTALFDSAVSGSRRRPKLRIWPKRSSDTKKGAPEIQVTTGVTETKVGKDTPIQKEHQTNPEIDSIKHRFHSYLRRHALLGAAALGRDELDASGTLLKSLEVEVIQIEGPRIKNMYVTELGYAALPFFLAFGVIYCAIRLFAGSPSPDALAIVRFREFFLLVAGCTVGSWLSYRIRNQKFRKIADLVQLESDQLNPRNRVLFAIGLTTVIGLIFQSGLVKIAINQFTSDFQYEGVRALIIGMFCGVSEIALGDVVGQRAGEFVSRAAPESPVSGR